MKISMVLQMMLLSLAFPLMAFGTSSHAEVSPVRSVASTTNAMQVVVENADQNQKSDYEKLADRLDKVSEKAESYYEKRYDELKATHNRFMVAVGVCLAVFTLFGVFLPIVVAMMQHRNFDGVIGVAKEKIGMELETKISEVVLGARLGNIAAMDIALSQETARLANLPMKTEEEKMQCEFALAVIIKTLHLVFEIAMQTRNAQVVVDEIKKYRNFVSRWAEGESSLRKELWLRAEGVMKGCVSRDAGAVTRRDYAELLSEHSESFLWLKRFYERIAPWKFEEEK